jgi:hypothetical protein
MRVLPALAKQTNYGRRWVTIELALRVTANQNACTKASALIVTHAKRTAPRVSKNKSSYVRRIIVQ